MRRSFVVERSKKYRGERILAYWGPGSRMIIITLGHIHTYLLFAFISKLLRLIMETHIYRSVQGKGIKYRARLATPKQMKKKEKI